MTQIGFYHLTRYSLERALPKLLDKALGAGMKVVVMASSPERVEDLTERLWTDDPDSWLPHGSARDGEAALQPVWLTTLEENPNQATVLVLCDGADSSQVGGFERCLDLFDGNDSLAVAAARERWRRWKEAGHQCIYYQQTPEGGWVEKARS
jgi:DNA polymerase-3 subunit chi